MEPKPQDVLSAGTDRPAPPPNWQSHRRQRLRPIALLRIATGLALALLLLFLLLFLPQHLADNQTEAPDENIQSLSSDEIIRNLAPAAGSTSGTTVEVEHRSVDLDIQFEWNSAELLLDGQRQLAALASALTSEELKALRFQIAGHTDASGSTDYNLKLSAERAEIVANYLARVYGVDRSRLETTGYGEERLKDPTTPRADENRRVEVTLIRAPDGN